MGLACLNNYRALETALPFTRRVAFSGPLYDKLGALFFLAYMWSKAAKPAGKIFCIQHGVNNTYTHTMQCPSYTPWKG